MRNSSERRIRHVSQLKKVDNARRPTTNQFLRDRGTRKTYQQIKVQGQKFFVEIKTTKE